MLNAFDDRAPFCPLVIHVDSLCCAMTAAAMYSRRPVGGSGRGFGWFRGGQADAHCRCAGREGGYVVDSEAAYFKDSQTFGIGKRGLKRLSRNGRCFRTLGRGGSATRVLMQGRMTTEAAEGADIIGGRQCRGL